MKAIKKIICAMFAFCALTLMLGGCGIGYCNMCGLGYTDCTVNGCYFFGNHIPSAEFRNEKDACCQAVKENKDDLDFAAEKIMQYDGKVYVSFVNEAAVVQCDDSVLYAAVTSDEELMSCLDRLAQNTRFEGIHPMQFSLSSPDSIYGICVDLETDIPAYAFRAEYITDPEMLIYTGERIDGDWYFSALLME